MARHVPPRERRIREMMAEAHALLRKERPLNARLRCQQVLALEPDRVDALMLLGALAGRGGDTTEALDLLARAAALRPMACAVASTSMDDASPARWASGG
ncbi:MAG: hypothetical protein ACKVQR_00715, partial [Aquabacterium sp.]